MTDIETDSELLSWARPDESLFDDRRRDAYLRNVAAVTSVKKGMTIRDAARLHGTNRGTLGSIMRMVDELAPDGRVWGFRACVPWRRRTLGVNAKHIEVPMGPGPNPPKLSHPARSLRLRLAALLANPSILADFA